MFPMENFGASLLYLVVTDKDNELWVYLSCNIKLLDWTQVDKELL